MPTKRTLIFAAAVLAIAVLVAIASLFLTPAGRQITSGEALVGGPFELTDQDGKRVTEKAFLGRYLLIFFGYTFCPDVCPTELQIMSDALDKMGAEAAKIQPIFITIDPARDTPEVMRAYVGNFRPGFIGLTGSDQDIAKAASAYRVFYGRAKGSEGSSDYLMDHSSIIYLMGPDGKYVKFFSYTTDSKSLAAELATAVNR